MITLGTNACRVLEFLGFDFEKEVEWNLISVSLLPSQTPHVSVNTDASLCLD